MPGAVNLFGTNAGMDYLKREGLSASADQFTHIVWATGGSMVPDDVMRAYYEKGKDSYMIHDETRALLEHLLHLLDQQGEEAVFAYIRKEIVGKKEYPKIPPRPWQLTGDGTYRTDRELEVIRKEAQKPS